MTSTEKTVAAPETIKTPAASPVIVKAVNPPATTLVAAKAAPQAAPKTVVKTAVKKTVARTKLQANTATKVAPALVLKPAVKASTVTLKPLVKTALVAPTKTPAKASVKPEKKSSGKAVAKATSKATVKASVKVDVKPKVEKLVKAKKPKLVRDSFTIPKNEYTVLDDLKQRAGKLANHAKKSEFIRAGIKALAAMSDAAFLQALKAVPAIKTGRPAKS